MSAGGEGYSDSVSFAGQLLAAHPGMIDSNFVSSVVLLAAHGTPDGALGVIINRPLHKALSDLKPEVEDPLLRNLPVYEGGPVSHNEILLTAWRWEAAQRNFRLYFGVDPQRMAAILKDDPLMEGRAFLGYAGWSAGQLEMELSRGDWVMGPFLHDLGKTSPSRLWKDLLKLRRPELWSLTDFPDNPSLN